MTDYEWSEYASAFTPHTVARFPGLIVEADYTSAPLVIPGNWTDLPRFRAVSINQGRQRLLQRTEVGQASVTLDNLGRQYDPTIHPQIRPSNHLRIRAVLNEGQDDEQIVDLFRGFVRSWPQEWPGKKDAVSRVEVEDAFALMARFEMQGEPIAEMMSGEHIRTVLTMFGWPEAGSIPEGTDWWILEDAASELGTNTVLGESLSQIDDGLTEIMSLDLEGNLLDHLLNVAETTEGGTFYIGPSGDIVFRERQVGGDDPIGTWGDEAGENKYTELVVTYDDSQLYNHIWYNRRGTPAVTSATVVDDASVANYGPRSLVQGDLLHSTDAAADERAEQALTKYAQPTLYPRRLSMRPKPDSNLWPLILGIPLGTTIVVRRRPPGGGEMIELSCYVIGVSYEITPETWDITWDLAEAPRVIPWWLLGVVGRSELGVTTALAEGPSFGIVNSDTAELLASPGIAVAGRNTVEQRAAVLSATASIAARGVFPQTARPTTSQITTGYSTWTTFGASLPTALNDQSDSTYIAASAQNRSNLGQLADLTDPGISTGHVFWVRCAVQVSGTGLNYARLYLGNPDSGGGTQLAHISIATALGVITDISDTLSAAEADSITDYTDLWWYVFKSGGTSQVAIYEVWLAIS